MKKALLDSKLKKLIHLCKISQNYKKLTVVGFILISNTMDEISTNLAIRPRKKDEGEKLWAYMNFINRVFREYLECTVIPTELIEQIKIVEILFFKLKGEIPYEHVKELFRTYFQLRKIKVPNLYKSMDLKNMPSHANFNLLLSLAPNQKAKNKDRDNFKTLLMHKIRQEESKLQKSLEDTGDKNSIEQALYLKEIKNSLLSGNKRRLSPGTQLGKSVFYRIAQRSSLKYMVWGGLLLFALLSGIVIVEAILYPYITVAVSLYMIVFVGLTILLFFVYHTYFKGKEGR